MEMKNSQKNMILMAAMASSFVAPFMGSSINLAIPAIGVEFGGGAVDLSWVVSAYLLTSAAFLLPFGRFADLVGQKTVFNWGIALLAFFTFLCGWAGSLFWLILFRLGQGVASAMIFSTSMAIVTAIFPAERRGRVLGLTVTATYTGLSLGPVLGGGINHYFGWRAIFYWTALFIAAVAAAALKAMQSGARRGAAGEKLDLPDSALYIAATAAVLYGFSSIASHAFSKYLLAAGLMALAGFFFRQYRRQEPMFDVRLFAGNSVFTLSNAAAMINYSATFALSFVLSLYLQVIRGFDSQTAGMILLVQPILMAAFSPFAGALSDRVQPRLVASAGMALNTAGLFLFTFLDMATPMWLLGLNLAFMGLGFALFSSPNTNAVMSSVGHKHYGVAASTLSTMRVVGQALSMAIVTLLFSLHIGAGLLTGGADDLLGAIRIAFILFTALCAAGTAASACRGDLSRGG